MRDPLEGVSLAGTIVTGADRAHIPARFRRLLDDAVARFADLDEPTDVYVYGSVATGVAVAGVSDVDLLTIGASRAGADEIAEAMSIRYVPDCRAVEVAVAQRDDYVGETDEAYGNRVFLRHYCVHLAGPHAVDVPDDFPADRRAARGFNGDIGRHLQRWRDDLDDGAEPTSLGRKLARKTLHAVAGLVSVHDQTWTTDRDSAASRWARIHPELAVNSPPCSPGATAPSPPPITRSTPFSAARSPPSSRGSEPTSDSGNDGPLPSTRRFRTLAPAPFRVVSGDV